MIKIGENLPFMEGGEVSIELQSEPIGTSNVEKRGLASGNDNRGRTAWDFLSERFSERKAKTPYNWYRFLFYMLIFACLGYTTYLVISGFSEINKNVRKITSAVDSIRDETNKTSLAVNSLTKAPVSSGWFGHHQFDVAACKARGVEALQRAGGQNINAEQSSSTYGTFSGNDGSSYVGVIHCPEDGIIYLYVMGHDVKVAENYKEKIKKEFEDIMANAVPKK